VRDCVAPRGLASYQKLDVESREKRMKLERKRVGRKLGEFERVKSRKVDDFPSFVYETLNHDKGLTKKIV